MRISHEAIYQVLYVQGRDALKGKLVACLGSSAIGTLVERTTGFTMLWHLPRMDEHGQTPTDTNENTNGLLRQYFPKGSDLARHGAEELNNRPRQTLNRTTPLEKFAGVFQ